VQRHIRDYDSFDERQPTGEVGDGANR